MRLISKIFKQLMQLNKIQKQITQSKKWAEYLNRHFSKEDIQLVKRYMKRCLTLLIIREVQNCNEVSPHSSQNGHHQKIYNNKCQRGCGKRVILLHCWWECTLIEPLWRAVRRFLKKLKTELSYIWPCIWPWTARRSNQSILKEINPEYSLEGPVLKLKL